ncbi:MAG: type II toxin-antitoxin system RelE/ParE family toxin [Magnetococcus sp. YQC-5]
MSPDDVRRCGDDGIIEKIFKRVWRHAFFLMIHINVYIIHSMKRIQFIDTAKDDLSTFPQEAKRVAGFNLWRVQTGRMPADWKPMPTVGQGAMEIRIHVEGAWRVIYVAKFEDAVYVLHAFQKKTQKTSQEDITLAARRYRQIGV